MKFRKVIEIEASQYIPGKELPPGVKENSCFGPYICLDAFCHHPLEGGEWISCNPPYAQIVNLDEWQQVDFQIKVNGCLTSWPVESISYDQIVMLSGKRSQLVNVFLDKQLSPGETVKVADGMSFIVL